MKKKICLIVLCAVSAFACAFGLVACGSNSENNNNNNSEQGGKNENLETYTPTEGLKYTDKGSYYELTSIGTATDTEIFIAKTYNGKPVTSIGQSAFSFIDIKSVTIPDSITRINDWAFSYSGLTSITIPDSVTSIGFGAFDYCESLTSATIGNGLTSFGYNIFLECINLSNVTIKDGAKYIGDSMFQNCSNLTSIKLPDSLEKIADSAFYGCSSLAGIFISKNVTSIGYATFYGCESLTVYYGGTEQDWNEINIGSYNDDLLNAPRHYNSVGNENSGDNDNNPTNPPTVSSFTITYTAGEGGHIVGAVSQTVIRGESGTAVIAVADEGYEFIEWSDGVQTAERQEKSVNNNIDVIAYFDVYSAEEFAGGLGTEDSPYLIINQKQLKNIRNYPDAFFKLNADIRLVGNFIPMYSDEVMFNGTLDGNGHKIIGLTIYNTSSFYTGLFACIGEDGVVRNLTLENVNVQGANYVGALAGYSLGTITDITVTGKVTYFAQNTYMVFIGGIIGRAEGEVNRCSSNTDVSCENTGNGAYVGGISGYCGYSGEIVETHTKGDITISSEIASVYGGGLFGDFSGDKFTACTATGNVTVSNKGNDACTYAGGLVGYSRSYTTITDCYSSGDVTVTSSLNSRNAYAYTGGLVGYSYGKLTVTDCYTLGNASIVDVGTGNLISYVYVGGIVGYIDNYSGLIITSCYTSGEVIAMTTENSTIGVHAGGLAGYSDSAIITDCYTVGDVIATHTNNSYSFAAMLGGLIGYCYSSTITGCYTSGEVRAITACVKYSSSAYIGGLVGVSQSTTITDCYTKGTLSAIYTGDISSEVSAYAYYVGGLLGYSEGWGSTTIKNCFSVGEIIAKDVDVVYVGGFVGCSAIYSESYSVKISNSYTVSNVTLTGKEATVYVGAFVGYGATMFTNVHWLYHENSRVEYAVGYNANMGVPTNIGATRHTTLAEFYTLADSLNEGLDEPVWEHLGEYTLPTFISKEED